ncbi:stalk domain-containing protein [Paenibacillus sepulcri]|uniref:Copper amine oxidase n=1 Tax=Paenibacillus sepulcri TaxID=359917 RepID=A0ABS7C3D7_9BACL|nr:copper amine oxidase [Paenibacillus sepulcri]
MKKWLIRFSMILCLVLLPFNALAGAAASNVEDFDASSLIKSDGTLWVWGNQLSVPAQIPGITDVQRVFSDQFIMKKDGSIWHWERNFATSGIQVSPVEALKNLTHVYSNGSESLAIDADGKTYLIPKVQGKLQLEEIAALPDIEDVADVNFYYEIQDQRWIPTWVFLKRDGTVWRSSDSLKSFEAIQSLSDIVQIAQNIAVKKDGTVWSWPSKFSEDQLPAGPLSAVQMTALTHIKQIVTNGSTDSYAAFAVIDDKGSVWFWGATTTGMSDGTTSHQSPVPLQLTSIKDARSVFFVEQSLIVFTGDGSIYETSVHREAMPANPDFTLLASDVSQVKAGDRHVILQKSNGGLWGWGVNKNGELGSGDYEFMHSTPVQMQKPVSIQLNGESVTMTSGVIIRNGQAFIPLRSLFEKLGAKVTWDVYKKIATVSRAAVQISVDFNGDTKLNNVAVKLENEPFILSGASYLPLRFISESLGAKVEWVQAQDKITITMK